jgi:hypothetical protein
MTIAVSVSDSSVVHAVPARAHPTGVTSAESIAANVPSTEPPTEMPSATTTEATAMTATPTTTSSHAHRHQQAARCILCIVGKARLRERCRGRKSKRKSADDTKREATALHDCTSIVAIVHGKGGATSRWKEERK